MDELISIYTNAGYDCIKISGKKSINIDKLRSIMLNKSCVFSGHSGVGKSTLINRLDSKINIKTLPISKSNLSGQHTTTFSEMYDLEFGSRIIDTPGIKGFGLYDIDKYELKDFFKEYKYEILLGLIILGAIVFKLWNNPYLIKQYFNAVNENDNASYYGSKSELDAEEFSIFSFGSSLSSVGGLNPGGRNALTSWNTTWKKIKKIVLLKSKLKKK